MRSVCENDYPGRPRVCLYSTPADDAAGRQPPDLDRHGDDRAQARHRPHHRGRAGHHRRHRSTTVAEAPVLGRASGRRDARGHGFVEPGHARPLGLIDKVQASTLDEAGVEAAVARVPARARAARRLRRCAATRSARTGASSRAGCPRSRTISTTAISTSRRSRSCAGAGSPSSPRVVEAGQARGARRHLRVDRRAEVLPRAASSAREFLQSMRLGRARAAAFPTATRCRAQVCAACGTIHYQNPKVVVGLPAGLGGAACCCASARSSRACGLWTLPAGFLENGETIVCGRRARDARGSATRASTIGELYTVISLPQINQVYVMFRARLLDLDFGPGPGEPRGAPVRRGRHPVGALAFRTITRTLRNFFLDRKLGAFPLRVCALERGRRCRPTCRARLDANCGCLRLPEPP